MDVRFAVGDHDQLAATHAGAEPAHPVGFRGRALAARGRGGVIQDKQLRGEPVELGRERSQVLAGRGAFGEPGLAAGEERAERGAEHSRVTAHLRDHEAKQDERRRGEQGEGPPEGLEPRALQPREILHEQEARFVRRADIGGEDGRRRLRGLGGTQRVPARAPGKAKRCFQRKREVATGAGRLWRARFGARRRRAERDAQKAALRFAKAVDQAGKPPGLPREVSLRGRLLEARGRADGFEVGFAREAALLKRALNGRAEKGNQSQSEQPAGVEAFHFRVGRCCK